MTNQPQDIYREFFQIFSKSVEKTLAKNLDSDICSKISMGFNSFVSVKNAEDLKQNDVLYKIDYATGNRQGNVAVLIPEALFAAISDVLTGGDGTDVYKGILSEIETNSVSQILNKVFKDVETSFKRAFAQEFIFSANSYILLKEMPDYNVNSGSTAFDFLAESTLALKDGDEYPIRILLNKSVVEQLMGDLGFSSANGGTRKLERNNIDLSCLSDIKINVTAELGRAQVPIKYALELVGGSVVELDTQNNADIKVFANGVEFAYAQIVAIGENFGLKITKIIAPEERLGCIK